MVIARVAWLEDALAAGALCFYVAVTLSVSEPSKSELAAYLRLARTVFTQVENAKRVHGVAAVETSALPISRLPSTDSVPLVTCSVTVTGSLASPVAGVTLTPEMAVEVFSSSETVAVAAAIGRAHV